MKALYAARDRTILATERLGHLTAELRTVNESLWDIEDAIRRCEQSDCARQFVLTVLAHALIALSLTIWDQISSLTVH